MSWQRTSVLLALIGSITAFVLTGHVAGAFWFGLLLVVMCFVAD